MSARVGSVQHSRIYKCQDTGYRTQGAEPGPLEQQLTRAIDLPCLATTNKQNKQKIQQLRFNDGLFRSLCTFRSICLLNLLNSYATSKDNKNSSHKPHSPSPSQLIHFVVFPFNLFEYCVCEWLCASVCVRPRECVRVFAFISRFHWHLFWHSMPTTRNPPISEVCGVSGCGLIGLL